jgi:tetratricopeptide (TPR) repeat protein
MVLATCALIMASLAAAGQAEPPNRAPQGKKGDAPKRDVPEDPKQRRYSEAVNARDAADRLRAAFEEAHKAGPIPEHADAAEAEFDGVVRAYEDAISRDTADHAEVARVVTYCRLRLAGAYQFVGRFERAAEVAEEAVDHAEGTPEEAEACFNVGLVYLPAMHKPAEALPWLKRARAVAEGQAEADPQAAAKWAVATAEAIARCERGMKKK